ncbi:hypothetical protein [Asticcacaulis sp. 201]|uniref:glycosyltransferase n=1 Tax=Asticcacaulis sp. 201 TaxID=3028787 RepID=UPI002916DE90|nr:hypothetical protein [Asticcacaulis sp. 201]MDV6331070.1 hypothetical protein [Asticcacaulis sp. 201]
MTSNVADIADGLERTARGPLVLLFYDGYERKVIPGFGGELISQSLRLARFLKRSAMRQQVRTGFYTAFLGLVKSLEAVGCDIRINDFAAARRRPSYPIGLAGYPTVISKVDLPNPVILGPGDPGLPPAAARTIQDPRFKKIIQPSDWISDMYVPLCGDKVLTWFAGIDAGDWPDYANEPKTVDFIIYDKIRWNRDTQVPAVLDRVTRRLKQDGRSFTVLRYGAHHHSEFKAALKKSKALIFLCEHETQGLAYQEALSANIPVLAWDEGKMIDPVLHPYLLENTEVSSVPYFSDACGRRFKIDQFEPVYEAFWRLLGTFQPRQYVEDTLSLPKAGEIYLKAYAELARR